MWKGKQSLVVLNDPILCCKFCCVNVQRRGLMVKCVLAVWMDLVQCSRAWSEGGLCYLMCLVPGLGSCTSAPVNLIITTVPQFRDWLPLGPVTKQSLNKHFLSRLSNFDSDSLELRSRVSFPSTYLFSLRYNLSYRSVAKVQPLNKVQNQECTDCLSAAPKEYLKHHCKNEVYFLL